MDVAFLLGMIVSLALDPLDIACGLLIGIVCRRWWQRIMATIAVTIPIVAYILNKNDLSLIDYGLDLTIARGFAIFAWACIGAVARALMERVSRQSSSGSA